MIWCSKSGSGRVLQCIPWRYKNYNDGIGFNYRSAVVYMSPSNDTSPPRRIYPARDFTFRKGDDENAGLSIIHTVHMGFRSSRYSDLPIASYNGTSWDEYGVRETSYSGVFAPGIEPASSSEYYNVPIYTNEGSFKSNKGFWTFTMTPPDLVQRRHTIRPYAVLLLSNINGTAPTVTPVGWHLFVYNSRTDTRTDANTLVLTASNEWDILSEQLATVYTGTINDGTRTRPNSRVIVIKSRLPGTSSWREQLFNRIDEVSIPFIECQSASTGDEVAILEYGCEYGIITGNDPS